jgi:hypothetical protein
VLSNAFLTHGCQTNGLNLIYHKAHFPEALPLNRQGFFCKVLDGLYEPSESHV